MATIYYGINAGQNKDQVVIGTSDPGTDVVVKASTTAIPSKGALFLHLERILMKSQESDHQTG